MFFRIGEALLGYSGIILTLGILSVIKEGASTDIVSSLTITLYSLKDIIYKILMVCISIGSMIFFYLFHRAKYIPVSLSICGIVGFGLMLIASFLQILDIHVGNVVNGVAAVDVIPFEIVIGIWFITKGITTR